MKFRPALPILLLTLTATMARAQEATPPAPKEPAPARTERGCVVNNNCQTETVYLANAVAQNDANEILVALRNILPPWIRIFLVGNENAIVLQGSPDELKLAHRLIHDLDLPKKIYRVTYTITGVDGDKRVGTQHYAVVLADGQRTTFKQGSKIPVATGSYDGGKTNGTQTQFTYLDVGMNIDTTINVYAGGIRLKAKLEQSSVAAEPATIAGVNEPIIRQTVLDGITDVTFNKPLILGSIDIPGTTHHLDLAANVEFVP